MPEAVYSFFNHLGIAGLVAGSGGAVYVIVRFRKNRLFRGSALALLSLLLLSTLLFFTRDRILTVWGTGVPYWGEEAYSPAVIGKIAPSVLTQRIHVHNFMWFLNFRFIPAGFLLSGSALTIQSLFRKCSLFPEKYLLSVSFFLFTMVFLVEILAGLIGIRGHFPM